MDRMLKGMLVLGVTAFFAVMWGLLIRSHVVVPAEMLVGPDYDRLLPAGQNERVESWGIYMGRTRIGESEMTVRRQDGGTLSVTTDAQLRLGAAAALLPQLSGTLDLLFRAEISPLRGLLRFQVGSERLDATLYGTVHEGELLLRGNAGTKKIDTTVPYDPGKLVAEMFSPLAAFPDLSDSEVGRSWSLDMVNPIAGSVQEVLVSLTRSRPLTMGEREVTVYRLTFVSGAGKWHSWVTEDGDVLIQGTPFGVTLRREDMPQGALDELLKDDAGRP